MSEIVRRPRIRFSAWFGFAVVHVAALGVFAVGFSWKGIALCLLSYYLRMFAVTAGFHRYFSHRSYRLSRVPQFLMAFLGQTAAQKGVLWWAAHHRHHHRYSDLPEDIHSPVQRGFWWSHMGWILAEDYEETNLAAVPDLAKFPELVWLNRNPYMATIAYALAMWIAFSWTGLLYGYFLSTVLLWHGTFSINSVMHVFGRRVYATTDDSRNSFLFALITMGEGWHNNHHHYPGSASQGFRWWEVDMSFYTLWLAERLGLVTNLRRVPADVREAALVVGPRGRTRLAEARDAFDAAADRLNERIHELSERWEGLRERARVSAHDALADLETARASAAERLATLQADYAAGLARTTRGAEARLAELRAEVESARAQLAEILARLVEAAESFGMPETEHA